MSTTAITLSRQVGLVSEMRTIANNMANLSTTGFRREGVVFSEFVSAGSGIGPSVSLTATRVRQIDLGQGPLTQTGGAFDFAIEGEGFFLIEADGGDQRLTRAGNFAPDSAGNLVTPDGLRLLDAGGAPVFIPAEANAITLAQDGTLAADGLPLTQLGLVVPADPFDLERTTGALFTAKEGTVAAPDGAILQGFLESANVNAVLEMARMIEVHRAYELGQSFLDRESDRRSKLIDTLTK